MQIAYALSQASCIVRDHDSLIRPIKDLGANRHVGHVEIEYMHMHAYIHKHIYYVHTYIHTYVRGNIHT